MSSPPAASLLAWYARHRRALPWRAMPGETPDPYRVWLSEIMLQQTSVTAVRPYYARFLARFPDLAALAAATEAEMLPYWAGLGYYARGRNLLAAAHAVHAAGDWPRDVAALRALPGIGAYTARAVAAIAFGIPAVPVDGNVERVAARVFAVTEPLPRARPALARLADRLGEDPDARAAPSDFAQALFDLGATLCTPRRPACALCPWRAHCAGLAAGIAARLPARAPKPARPVRHAALFALTDGTRLLLERREPRGLFGGMSVLPGTPLADAPVPEAEAAAHRPAGTEGWERRGTVTHVLTHRELRLEVWAARIDAFPDAALAPPGRHAAPLDRLAREALPGAMRRCLALAGIDPAAGTTAAAPPALTAPPPGTKLASPRGAPPRG